MLVVGVRLSLMVTDVFMMAVHEVGSWRRRREHASVSGAKGQGEASRVRSDAEDATAGKFDIVSLGPSIGSGVRSRQGE